MVRLAALLLLAGCVPLSYAFTPANNRPIHPKPVGCKFDVHTSQPQNAYEEIGELKHYNGPPPKDVDKFRSAVAEQVCQGGGDAVIATANDKGQFTLGMVIRYTRPLAEPVKPVSDMPAVQQTDTETPIKQ